MGSIVGMSDDLRRGLGGAGVTPSGEAGLVDYAVSFLSGWGDEEVGCLTGLLVECSLDPKRSFDVWASAVEPGCGDPDPHSRSTGFLRRSANLLETPGSQQPRDRQGVGGDEDRGGGRRGRDRVKV